MSYLYLQLFNIIICYGFSFQNSSLENISKYSVSPSPLSGNSPVLSSAGTGSLSSRGSRGSVTRARVTCLTSDPASPSEDCAQYGSVLLDIVSGTAHWSPEAPRRAITPDRQNIAIFQGRARHCKQLWVF